MPIRPKDVESPLPHATGRFGQFEDESQDRNASLLGMWTFLASEIMFFGALFSGYFIYRLFYPEAYLAASARLDLVLGSVNTALLLIGSVAMSLAIRYASEGKRSATATCLGGAACLGLVFLAIKGYEYRKEAVEGLVPFNGWPFRFEGGDSTHARLFFTQYFIMTGIHALHLAIGVILSGVLAIRALAGKPSWLAGMGVEMGALYWHFVDIVWIFLFPMLYLAR